MRGGERGGLFGEEGAGGGDVGGVVDVDDFAKVVGAQAQAGGDEGALVVAHAADAVGHALAQYADGGGGEAVDAAGDVADAGEGLVAEGGDDAVGVGVDVQRLFVVDELGDGHISVAGVVGGEGPGIAAEVVGTEDGVDGGEDELGAGGEDGADLVEAVHRAGRGLHHQLYGGVELAAHFLQIVTHLCHLFVDDDGDALGLA